MNAKSYEELLKKAQQMVGHDVEVVMGRGDLLLLDIDHKFDWDDFEPFPVSLRLLGMFPEIVKDEGLHITMWASKSGNTHIAVYTPKHYFSIADRVSLQAVLGSDLKREALCLRDHHAGGQYTVALFRPAKSQVQVITAEVLASILDGSPLY